MSELVWGIKNGDLDQVKDIVEQKVNMLRCYISGALKPDELAVVSIFVI